MIKGINKQIIEVKCTDEYFDKVLLFVRADKHDLPSGVLYKGAENFCTRLLPSRHSSNYRLLKALLLVLSIVSLVAIVIYFCVFL